MNKNTNENLKKNNLGRISGRIPRYVKYLENFPDIVQFGGDARESLLEQTEGRGTSSQKK